MRYNNPKLNLNTYLNLKLYNQRLINKYLLLNLGKDVNYKPNKI